MRLLPESEQTITRMGADHVAVSAHENCGYRHYTKVALVDLPNDQIGMDDLKRVGIDVVDGRAVR
jgi:hypothetical protein